MKGRRREVKAVKGGHGRMRKAVGKDKVWKEKRAFLVSFWKSFSIFPKFLLFENFSCTIP